MALTRKTKQTETEILNLEPYIGKVKNRLAYVGIELEGGWSKMPEGLKLVNDGSVFAGGSFNLNQALRDNPNFKKGETASAPLEPILVDRWVKASHPTHIDETCGLHVHMSFQHAYYYELLMSETYMETMIHYLSKWGEQANIPRTHAFWNRLAGNNSYCRKKFAPLAQVMATSKSFDRSNPDGRYTFLNYCFRYRGTIECRVLPMFETVALSTKAIRTLMDITNASIVAMKKRKERDGTEVVLTSRDSEEVDHQRLI